MQSGINSYSGRLIEGLESFGSLVAIFPSPPHLPHHFWQQKYTTALKDE